MVAQRERHQRLRARVRPAVVEDHKVAAGLGRHVGKVVVADVGALLLLRAHGHGEVLLVLDLAKELALLLRRIAVGRKQLERRADDQLVKLLLLATVHAHVHVVLCAAHGRDLAVEVRGVAQRAVDAGPDGVGAVLPRPEPAGGKELPHGERVQVLQDVRGGNLVEVAIAKARERPLPHKLGVLAVVQLQKLAKRHAQVLQVRVLALDVRQLHLGRRTWPLVAALCHAAVSVDVVALVLGRKQVVELAHLHDLLEQPQLALLDGCAVRVHEAAAHLRAVGVGRVAKLLALVHGKVRVAAHDRAHLDGAVLPLSLAVLHLHERAERLAAHAPAALEDGVVVKPVLLEVHGQREPGGASTHDADPAVPVHWLPLSDPDRRGAQGHVQTPV